mmetsp:Transcript_23737/g.48717  ORF Transcript_23737/g.48717 Transcript_23737/m.48717 type:complete len:276 (+) Transcript_23737:984-1811(+)
MAGFNTIWMCDTRRWPTRQDGVSSKVVRMTISWCRCRNGSLFRNGMRLQSRLLGLEFEFECGRRRRRRCRARPAVFHGSPRTGDLRAVLLHRRPGARGVRLRFDRLVSHPLQFGHRGDPGGRLHRLSLPGHGRRRPVDVPGRVSALVFGGGGRRQRLFGRLSEPAGGPPHRGGLRHDAGGRRRLATSRAVRDCGAQPIGERAVEVSQDRPAHHPEIGPAERGNEWRRRRRRRRRRVHRLGNRGAGVVRCDAGRATNINDDDDDTKAKPKRRRARL